MMVTGGLTSKSSSLHPNERTSRFLQKMALWSDVAGIASMLLVLGGPRNIGLLRLANCVGLGSVGIEVSANFYSKNFLSMPLTGTIGVTQMVNMILEERPIANTPLGFEITNRILGVQSLVSFVQFIASISIYGFPAIQKNINRRNGPVTTPLGIVGSIRDLVLCTLMSETIDVRFIPEPPPSSETVANNARQLLEDLRRQRNVRENPTTCEHFGGCYNPGCQMNDENILTQYVQCKSCRDTFCRSCTLQNNSQCRTCESREWNQHYQCDVCNLGASPAAGTPRVSNSGLSFSIPNRPSSPEHGLRIPITLRRERLSSPLRLVPEITGPSVEVPTNAGGEGGLLSRQSSSLSSDGRVETGWEKFYDILFTKR